MFICKNNKLLPFASANSNAKIKLIIMFNCKSNKLLPFACAHCNAKIKLMFMFICNSNKLLNKKKQILESTDFVYFS